MAAYPVSKRRRELGNPGGVGRTAEGSVKSGVGTAFRLPTHGSAAGLFLGILASRVLASIVMRRPPAIPWCRPVPFWLWRCWACWLRGFQRGAFRCSQ
jgi:hypothetical protein